MVLGFHGSLYQKCSGWLDACSRLVQAMAIQGLVSHLPMPARHASDTNTWMSALKTDSKVGVHVSDGLLPLPVEGTAPDGHREWRTFDVGESLVLIRDAVGAHLILHDYIG